MPLQKELSLDTPFADVRHETVLSVVRTAALIGMRGADVFRPYDLTEAQFNVLLVLKYKDHELTQSDLGKRLVITRASVTSVLDKLEAKALVTREDVPGNRRIFHVELTPKGRRLVEEVEPVYRQAIHRALSGLNEKECRVLIGLLDRLRLGLGSVTGE